VDAELQLDDAQCFRAELVLRNPCPDASESSASKLGFELEQFLRGCEGSEPPKPEDPRILERLCVNPDLFCVSAFNEMSCSGATPGELTYKLQVSGINQAGLLAYLSLVFFRCGFNIIHTAITTTGPDSDSQLSFTLTTTSPRAAKMLHTHLDITSPTCGTAASLRKTSGSSATDVGSTSSRSVANDEFSWLFPNPSAVKDSGKTSELEHDLIHLANGDVYDGQCIQCTGGVKQHGYGTYTYCGQQSTTYKQYKGEWFQGKKHGHGVLFFESGGVYVGQWQHNQRHGLGVMLDYPADAAPVGMPSYTFEGEWCEDQRCGFGIEEAGDHIYYGSFHAGRPSGRGVQVNFDTNLRITGCEALVGRCWKPLLGELEVEAAELQAAELQVVEEGEEGVSPQSDNAIGVRSRRGSSMTVPKSASDTQCSASLCKEPQSPLFQNHRQDSPVCFAGVPRLASPSPQQLQPSRPPMPSPSAASAMWMASPRASPGASPRHSPRCSGAAGAAWMASPLASPGGRESLRRVASRSAPCSPRDDKGVQSAPSSPTHEGSIEFVMLEGDKIMSTDTTPDDPQQSSQRQRAETAPNRGREDDVSPHATTPRALLCHRPPAGASTAAHTDTAASGNNGLGPQRPTPLEHAGSSASLVRNDSVASGQQLPQPSQQRGNSSTADRRAVTPERSTRSGRPILCPMLWSENELAAFLSCLGLSTDTARSVQRHKLKGVNQLVQMSNGELNSKFGMNSYVERRLVRKALTRFLELDRWQNVAKARRLPDLMADSGLREFLVPVDELRIEGEISQGGFGQVYRGILRPRVRRGRLEAGKEYPVAVKDMKGDRMLRLRELLKEGRVMSSLHHPNMCMFRGICADRSRATILSELMDCSLFDLIHQPSRLNWRGDLTLPCVLRLSQGICAGIAYLHSKKLVHADLKSSNILINYTSSKDPTPKICDFGHVAVRTHPSPHDRCGTPHWAAPEALRNEAVGPAADVFSFGVMLWEMLTQTLPHQNLTFAQVVGAVGWAEWTPDLDVLPEVPSGLFDLLRRCLRFLPAERPGVLEAKATLKQQLRGPRREALFRLSGFLS